MKTMDFLLVDRVLPFQLEAGDFIKVNGRIVDILDIEETETGFDVFVHDAFEESQKLSIVDTELVAIYLPD